MTPPSPPSALVLAGGPDREREVSLQSAASVAKALQAAGFLVHHRTIDRLTATQLADMPGDVIFPVLHGSFGEGGPLQDILESSTRPYVGCRPHAARLAMDKLATKLTAAAASIPTAPAAVLNTADDACPIPFHSPLGQGVVLKPIHDGSSVGVRLIRDPSHWPEALASVRAEIRGNPGRAYLVEALVAPPRPTGDQPAPRTRELTVALLADAHPPHTLRPLQVIQITPATDFYDYDAKYLRDDTSYTIVPDSDPVVPFVRDAAARLASTLNLRHLARADFLDPASPHLPPQLLEVNTMPGFTSHSLFPMAAAHAGLDLPALCRHLARLALADLTPPLHVSLHGYKAG